SAGAPNEGLSNAHAPSFTEVSIRGRGPMSAVRMKRMGAFLRGFRKILTCLLLPKCQFEERAPPPPQVDAAPASPSKARLRQRSWEGAIAAGRRSARWSRA